MAPLLRKPWSARAQAGLTESQRRRMPARAIGTARDLWLGGAAVLVVDDVWTTGTTLLRCARALRGAGAGEVFVLTLFRALGRYRSAG
jgi:predicted amidophosphoribosyltransferase